MAASPDQNTLEISSKVIAGVFKIKGASLAATTFVSYNQMGSA